MATTGIWKVEKRLDHVIDYVINPEKTMKDGDYQELHKLDGYEKLNYETEEECFVSSLNCSTHRPYKDMMLTKELYGKKSGILGYHAFQSFKEGEITPTQAHLIGVKLAEEILGDRFELEDISQIHKIKKYIERNEVYEETLFHKSINASISVEDEVEYKLLSEDLKSAINKLNDIQKRRIQKYFFENKTYEEIASEENCSKVAVKYSIDIALEKISKKIKI